MYAPLVIFAYKRADKLEKCLSALEKNHEVIETKLYIFCDGPKKESDIVDVQKVRELVHEYSYISKFKEVNIVESEENKGLANSIIGGVTEVIKKYGKIIVLEDDIIVKPNFLKYMNDALDYYENYQQYGSISAYTLPLKKLKKYDKDVYVIRKGECWGWATWENRWINVDWQLEDYVSYLKDKKKRKEFEKLQNGIDKMLIAQMEGRIDSWAVRWCYHLFKKGLLTVYPTVSKVMNIGMDGSGTHFTEKKCVNYNSEISKKESKDSWLFEALDVDFELERKVAVFERNEDIKEKLKSIVTCRR